MSDVITPQALHKLFNGMNSAQMESITQAAAQLIGTSTSIAEPTSLAIPKASTVAMKKKGDVPVSVKATRPLNSYMAFRAYYSKMFPGLQQKEISGFLTFLWHQDDSKAKWSVLAKAYSVIRDSIGKDNAPLELFLAINAPTIGMTAPEVYLTIGGFEMSQDENGASKLVQVQQAVPKGNQMMMPNVSVDDIIVNCVACGYANVDQLNLTMPTNQGTLTMATSASSVTTTHGTVVSDSTGSNQTTHGSSNQTVNDQAIINHVNDAITRLGSEMKAVADGVGHLNETDYAMFASALNMPPPGPHGWNLDANTYDPFQGDAFNAFDIGQGMDDPTLFDTTFTDPEFLNMMEEYFL